MLNLMLGLHDIVGGLGNTRVGSYLYSREIKKLTEGFVLLLQQPDRKLGMTWQCVNLEMECVRKLLFRYAYKSDYLLYYSLIA
jgi:hypothetical protein